uniref:Uncharacterized protein n=1 Tax=Romanomermis culicivorax TaxID=13658 RepID=A0A915HSA8_ROMCU
MMAAPDFIDTVLGIGSDLNNEVFANAFDDFGKRHKMEFTCNKFIYMLYGAIFTLPLTQKLNEHKIDALMVAKKSRDLTLAISYATDDGSLSLKVIRFNPNDPLNNSPIGRSAFLDMIQVLSSVKRRKVSDLDLNSALSEFYDVTFQGKTGQTSSDFMPKISRKPRQAGRFDTLNSMFPELVRIQESKFARSATIFLEQLQSTNYDVVKYNMHALIRLLIMQHHIQTEVVELKTTSRHLYYSFLIGALEMNWARSHRLNIQATFNWKTRNIQGFMIHQEPHGKNWESEPIKCVVQLLTNGQPSHEFYAQEMFDNIGNSMPASDFRLIIVGIEHEKLIDASKTRMDIPSFQKLTYTHLLELNPWENLVDLLLKPFTSADQSSRYKIQYCIEKLSEMGRYGLHTYLYGQLMSYNKYDVEKNVYHDNNDREGLTRFLFKIRGTKIGFLFDIVQRNMYNKWSGREKIVPIHDPNLVDLLHTRRRRKSSFDTLCSNDPETKETVIDNEEGMKADLEKLPADKALAFSRRFHMKMRSHLKTVDRVGK